ncbi:MAG: hypothetical protein WAU89_17970 [Candidatus Acidiferrales bacterium]
MPRKSATEAKQDINQTLLVQTATNVQNMSDRLFGANGDGGAIHFILTQHKELAEKMEHNKQELLDRIDGTKKDLQTSIDSNKEKTDTAIQKVDDKHDSLNTRVNWFAGGIATLGTLITFLLAAFGIYHKVR